jgi:hypothetical protein
MRLVAQAGALIGRSFQLSLLRTVSTLTELELRTGLALLIEADLIVQRGIPPDLTYTFRHALIQDAAQGSLGPVPVLCRSFDHILCSKGDEPWAQAGRMNFAKKRCG